MLQPNMHGCSGFLKPPEGQASPQTGMYRRTMVVGAGLKGQFIGHEALGGIRNRVGRAVLSSAMLVSEPPQDRDWSG